MAWMAKTTLPMFVLKSYSPSRMLFFKNQKQPIMLQTGKFVHTVG
jgi:hypothetical protein